MRESFEEAMKEEGPYRTSAKPVDTKQIPWKKYLGYGLLALTLSGAILAMSDFIHQREIQSNNHTTACRRFCSTTQFRCFDNQLCGATYYNDGRTIGSYCECAVFLDRMNNVFQVETRRQEYVDGRWLWRGEVD